MTALSGCRPQQPFYLRESGDLSHYLGVATDIEYPDVQSTTLDEVEQSLPPYTLDNLKFASYWDLPLEEAIKNALANCQGHEIAGRPLCQLGLQQSRPDRRSARCDDHGSRRGPHGLRSGHHRDHAILAASNMPCRRSTPSGPTACRTTRTTTSRTCCRSSRSRTSSARSSRKTPARSTRSSPRFRPRAVSSR